METLLRWGIGTAVVGVLVSVFVQDWRWRGVYWHTFPLLAGLLVAYRWLTIPFSYDAVVADFGINVCFVGLQLAGIWLYVQLRFRPSQEPLSTYLGLGDVLYWLTTAIFFSPVSYILYFLASLVVALAVFVAVRWVQPATDKRMPLAGLQAGFLALLLSISWVLPSFQPVSNPRGLVYLIGP